MLAAHSTDECNSLPLHGFFDIGHEGFLGQFGCACACRCLWGVYANVVCVRVCKKECMCLCMCVVGVYVSGGCGNVCVCVGGV